MQRIAKPVSRRPDKGGPFFDYVVSAMHDQALRARALRAALALQEHRIAATRQTSAEQRWEGEGGNMRNCAPGGHS